MVTKKATAKSKLIRSLQHKEKGSASESVLVISLPSKEGRKIKSALKSLAEKNFRSLSNQVSVILCEHLEKIGKL